MTPSEKIEIDEILIGSFDATNAGVNVIVKLAALALIADFLENFIFKFSEL